MSLRQAAAFIQRVASDPSLRRNLENLKPPVDLDCIQAIGARLGYDFTAAELRRAFAFDWGMRWCHFTADAGNPAILARSNDLK